MVLAPIFIPPPTYGHPLEVLLLARLRQQGEMLMKTYIKAHSSGGVCFVSRDAAKMIFPEFLASPTVNNRYCDTAASALADAVRRTLLQAPVRGGKDAVLVLTGAPASGKTGSVGSNHFDRIGMEHETILSSLERTQELINQSWGAGRILTMRLFYTKDPRINVQRMITRARRIGRTVPISYMAKSYIRVPSVVDKIQTKYGSSLSILVTDNSRTPIEAVHHDDVARALFDVNRYTERSALEAMHAELDKIAKGPEGIEPDILEEALRD